MRQPLHELVHRKYPAVAKDLVGPLLELLQLSREHFEGDVDKFLILLVVGLRTMQHPDFASYSQEELLSGQLAVLPSLGTNARSIAASTGIPKETVRRKVAELVLAGWFARHGASLHYTAQAYRELAPVREKIRRMAVRHYEVIAGLCVAEEVRTGGA